MKFFGSRRSSKLSPSPAPVALGSKPSSATSTTSFVSLRTKRNVHTVVEGNRLTSQVITVTTDDGRKFTRQGPSENFLIEHLDPAARTFAIKSRRTGKYCSDGGDGGIVCDKDSVGASETFTAVLNEAGEVALKGYRVDKAQGRFCADLPDSNALVCNRTNANHHSARFKATNPLAFAPPPPSEPPAATTLVTPPLDPNATTTVTVPPATSSAPTTVIIPPSQPPPADSTTPSPVTTIDAPPTDAENSKITIPPPDPQTTTVVNIPPSDTPKTTTITVPPATTTPEPEPEPEPETRTTTGPRPAPDAPFLPEPQQALVLPRTDLATAGLALVAGLVIYFFFLRRL